MKQIGITILLAALVVWSTGCSSRQAGQQLPATEPDIKGTVTQVTTEAGDSRILVEEDPADSSGTAKGWVRVTGEAQVWERNGDELHESAGGELKEGSVVSVWFDGPVLMSYPLQAGAKIVVLEK